MNIIFQINGGLGKCILATSVIKSIKDKYLDCNLIVVSGYPEVFLNNPLVYRSFAFGQSSYFFQDFIEDKDYLVLAHDPYQETGYLKQNEHLSETWTKMFDLPFNGYKPDIFLTERERSFFSKKFVFEKPIFLIQSNGGAPQQEQKYSWARDIPYVIVGQVIEKYRDTHTILHIKRDDQYSFPDTVPISDSFRALCVLIELSSKRLFIDSFAQHAAAALSKPSTVLWIANSPEVFGYQLHDNILANPHTKKPELKHSYLQKFDITGSLLEFPYHSESEIFNIDPIIDSLNRQNG